MKLNLGCGEDIINGFVNIDIHPYPGVDHIVNLEMNWPWDNNSIEHIFAADIIEHLHDKIHTMNEAYRVLIPEGTFHIVVPTTNGMGAFQDPTHVSYWNLNSFRYYEKGSIYRNKFAEAYGIIAEFKVLDYKLYEDPVWKDGEKLAIALQKPIEPADKKAEQLSLKELLEPIQGNVP